MKILHVITSLYTGGAERLMVDLLPRLSDGGSNQVDLLLLNGVDTPFKKSLEQNGINVYSVSVTNDVYNPKKIIGIRRFLSSHRYNIIHTHNTACQFFVPLSRVLSSHEGVLVTTEHSSASRRRSHWWFKPFDLWIYNSYAAIVCIADRAKSNLEDYIGTRNNILTISNGVNTKRFIRPLKSIFGQTHFTITMVAALRVEKDHETVLRALCYLPESYQLRFVGGGVKESDLKAHAAQLGVTGRVDFMGMRQDVPEILEQSDIVLLSSHWEGMSLSSIEGMASGRPFIASDVDGLREMVGGAGVLFPHGDEKILAQKIQWLCEHPDEYRNVARRCQEKALQYDISVTANKYLELYKNLCPTDN